MKANELRIGNCICKSLQSGNGRKLFQKINAHDLLRIEDDNLFNYEPIPLTEEILLKCGFQIRDKNYSLNYGGESMRFAILETNIKNPFILYFHGRFGFNTESGRKDGDFCITHFHQLQNLYFALTNEELTFNNL